MLVHIAYMLIDGRAQSDWRSPEGCFYICMADQAIIVSEKGMHEPPFPSNDGGGFAQLTQCSVTPGPDSHSIFTLQTKTTFSFEENAFSWAVDRKKWRIQLPLLDNPKHSTPLVVLLTLHIRSDYILGVFLMNIFYLVTIAKNIPVLLAGWHRDRGDKRGNLGEKWFSQRRNCFFCLLSRFSSLSHLWYHFDLFSLFQLPVQCWII